MNNDQQLVSELMKPRRKVMNLYPGCKFKVGDILYWHSTGESGFGNDGFYSLSSHYEISVSLYPPGDIEAYPHLFKKMEWWEQRSLEIFRAIKYAKVTTYRHYWLVGDIVEVTALYLGSPKDFYGFDLKGKQHAFCDVEPATSTEYLNQLKKIKT